LNELTDDELAAYLMAVREALSARDGMASQAHN
jgi:hypothetical protein